MLCGRVAASTPEVHLYMETYSANPPPLQEVRRPLLQLFESNFLAAVLGPSLLQPYVLFYLFSSLLFSSLLSPLSFSLSLFLFSLFSLPCLSLSLSLSVSVSLSFSFSLFLSVCRILTRIYVRSEAASSSAMIYLTHLLPVLNSTLLDSVALFLFGVSSLIQFF